LATLRDNYICLQSCAALGIIQVKEKFMVTINQALLIIEANLPQQKPEIVELPDSIGKVLAEDIFAPHEYPSCDISLMDGFAVKWEDVRTVLPAKSVRLKIAGASPAGNPFYGEIKNGEAVQIFTGAKLPEGADTIIPIEDCQLSDNYISVFKANNINQFVSFMGTDISIGETIAWSGTLLTAPLIGILASVGIERISTYQKPKVAVIVTGNELVPFNQAKENYQIWDSNRIMLTAAVENSCGKVTTSHCLKDEKETIGQVIKTSGKGHELIIISGGSSNGAFDFSKQAVEKSGYKILFEGVFQKPGKSFFCARKNETLLFGLPGTPQAAYLCFAHYVFPVINKLSGKKFAWKKICGRLSDDLLNEKSWSQFKPIQLKRAEKDYPSIINLKNKKLTLTENVIYSDGYIILNKNDSYKKHELVDVFLFPDKKYFDNNLSQDQGVKG
jgi:molybdenum cofactor synthesis domain-containing protein